MGRCINVLLLLVAFQAVVFPPSSNADLMEGFYSTTNCTANVEGIVRDVVQQFVNADRGIGAGLIRLHFHDCFVRGCDGSVLLATSSVNPDPERNSPANGGLRGQDVIEQAKSQLEGQCPGIVSCADIVAFAARDAANILSSGLINYTVPSGRRDGNVSTNSEALPNLPAPFHQIEQLINLFKSKKFSEDELVTLSGAHSIGRSHCSSFSDRIYPTINRTMNMQYGTGLQKTCPQNANSTITTDQDQTTPSVLDKQYYTNVLSGTVLFNSDWALLDNPVTKAEVIVNTLSNTLWAVKFAAAMRKMGGMDVLTGNQGEIRRVCNVTTSG